MILNISFLSFLIISKCSLLLKNWIFKLSIQFIFIILNDIINLGLGWTNCQECIEGAHFNNLKTKCICDQGKYLSSDNIC